MLPPDFKAVQARAHMLFFGPRPAFFLAAERRAIGAHFFLPLPCEKIFSWKEPVPSKRGGTDFGVEGLAHGTWHTLHHSCYHRELCSRGSPLNDGSKPALSARAPALSALRSAIILHHLACHGLTDGDDVGAGRRGSKAAAAASSQLYPIRRLG